jgi:hypothetical protein
MRGLFVFALLTVAPVGAQPAVAFKVHVVDSLSGAPIGGANVTLSRDNGGGTWGRTDVTGVFAGQAEPTGACILFVARKGYRTTGGGPLGHAVELRPEGQNDFTVNMLPLGVLTGRILDQYGDPLRNAIVRTEDKLSTPEGDAFQSSSTAVTDDRGEYRISEVEPGKHFIAVEYSSSRTERGLGVRQSTRWPQTGGLLLYPNAKDISQAYEVEVTAGTVTRLRDVRLTIGPAVIISGHIQPSPSEQGQQLSLTRTDNLALNSMPTVQGGRSEADGSFKLSALPGKYVLAASDPTSGKTSRPLPIELADEDVTGLTIDLNVEYRISGRISLEGDERLDFSKLTLNFGGQPVKLDVNGAFQSDLFQPKGRYLLRELPAGWYVKSLDVAGKRISGHLFLIEPGISDVTLTLSPQAAKVSVLAIKGDSGLTAAIVLLLPDAGADPDVESALVAEADGSGTFTIPGVPPGAYRVFALDTSGWVFAMRPDLLLEKYRQDAPLIEVKERERRELTTRTLKLKPE